MTVRIEHPKRLRVMAEYGSSGIWVVEPYGPWRHGMISHSKLRLPSDLAARFAAWIELYWQRLDPNKFKLEAFNAEGRSLAVALKEFVGSETEVIFEPESEDGGLGSPEIILAGSASRNQ